MDAYIKHESGRKYCDFKKHNLHIVGYSMPINKSLNKKELLKYIYTEKKQPNSIPYVTSYYVERWGFCLTQNELEALEDGIYKVVIDASLFNGELNYGELLIPGKSNKEILCLNVSKFLGIK